MGTAGIGTLKLLLDSKSSLFILFSDNHRRRTIVHHPGMVGADELAVETLA
jgi:hypothetical protein